MIAQDSPVKIAALMPLRIDLEKTMFPQVMPQLSQVFDEIIVLHDQSENKIARDYAGLFTEELRVEGGNGVWNDWLNRVTLLARAAKYGCRWVAWPDDDETLGSDMTRTRVHEICTDADLNDCVAVTVKVQTAWSQSHWRCDGIFGKQMKPFFQLNPFLLHPVSFDSTPDRKLHAFPTPAGKMCQSSSSIIHWGMRTLALREKNVAKYEAADKDCKFSPVPYRYLLDEQGIELKPFLW